MSLYLDEDDCAFEICGEGKTAAEWRAIALTLEAQGFPRIDPLFGGRYMPAVRAWLDAYNRVDKIMPARRGREVWVEPKPRDSSGAVKPANVVPIGGRDRT